MPPQTNGEPPSTGLGTHGKPQQSALVAQACPCFDPASTHAFGVVTQRGMPSRSCTQTAGFWFTFPAQQLFSALHELVASLQTAPAARHACPLSQRPTGSLGLFLEQRTLPLPPGSPGAPQQSRSVRQISPAGRQPLGGWHTGTPVGPNGAHARLQHSPPHAGMATPPSPASTTPPSAADPAHT
jgi:hypothetical protein